MRCHLHFVPLRPSFFSLPPAAVGATVTALSALAASYFSPFAPIELPTLITAMTSVTKPHSHATANAADFKRSDADAADANSHASSVLVVGTLTGRVQCLDLSGPVPQWYAEPKDRPVSQSQVTALSALPACDSFCVGFSDGHFQIRSSLDNALRGM